MYLHTPTTNETYLQEKNKAVVIPLIQISFTLKAQTKHSDFMLKIVADSETLMFKEL